MIQENIKNLCNLMYIWSCANRILTLKKTILMLVYVSLNQKYRPNSSTNRIKDILQVKNLVTFNFANIMNIIDSYEYILVALMGIAK